MRIGVLGAPEAGKTKFARALAKSFDLKVVDNYVQRLQKDSGLALGPWSAYSEIFMVTGVRAAAEAKHPDNYITAGTIVDSIVYAMTHTDVVLHHSPEVARTNYAAAQAAVQGLSMWYAEAWDYHLAFYLPYSDEQKREKTGTWEAALDAAYLAVLESYQTPFVYALRGNHEERVKIASDALTAAREEESDKDEAPEASGR